MSFVRKLFQFYIHSNIHVSIAAACMVLLTGFYFNINSIDVSLFVGFSTFVAYNWIRYLKYRNKGLREDVCAWFEKNKVLLVLLIGMACCYLIVLLRTFKIDSLFVMIPFLGVTIFYIYPLEYGSKKISLRKIPGLKIFCIAISWSGLIVLLPLVQNNLSVNTNVLLFFLQQFLFVLVLTIPFDLRDMRFDKKELKTIPQVLGVIPTKVVGIVLIALFCCIYFVLFKGSLLWNGFIIGGVLAFVLLKSTVNQTTYFASFWVEGIPVLWFVLILLFGA